MESLIIPIPEVLGFLNRYFLKKDLIFRTWIFFKISKNMTFKHLPLFCDLFIKFYTKLEKNIYDINIF